MRPIDGESLKEEISNWTMTITGIRGGKSILDEFVREYRKSILRTIDEQPTIEQYGTWIPVSSGKLPNTEKPYKAVLLQLKNSMVAGYTNKAGQWFVDTGDGYCEELNEKPIAWMPLPLPYREEKDDRD